MTFKTALSTLSRSTRLANSPSLLPTLTRRPLWEAGTMPMVLPAQQGKGVVWGWARGGQRGFQSFRPLQHGGKGRPEPGTGIKITFKNHKGEVLKVVEGNEGEDIVDLSWEWDLDIEAACEKSIACSTCHCIFESDVYERLPEPSEDEEDMLDLAFGLTDTSRLGCQVKLTKDMDGTCITLPSATRNLRVDGSKPTPH